MQHALRAILLSAVVCAAMTSCGTLAPAVTVTGGLSLSLSDFRAIERLLPTLGIRRPIYLIHMETPDRVKVSCALTSFASDAAAERFERDRRVSFDAVSFTAVRRNGRWFAEPSSVQKSRATFNEW